MTAREWIKLNWTRYENKRAKCINDCSKELGIAKRTVRKAVIDLELKHHVNFNDVGDKTLCEFGDSPTVTKMGDFAEMETVSNIPLTVEDLMVLSELDPEMWIVTKPIVNFWGNNKNPNYQVKATFERIISEGAETFLKELKEDMCKLAPHFLTMVYSESDEEGYMLEIDLFDAHLGMESNKYNLEIGESRYYNSVKRILNWYRGKNITKIVFPMGNDLLNSDVLGKSTTKGTQMEDEATNSRNTYRRAFDTLRKSLELCRAVAPVEVIAVEGNHDKASTFLLLHALEAYYTNCEEITIINDGKPLHFTSWGNNLIGFTHGDSIKQNNLPLVMATEASPEEWCNSAKGVRQFRIGHGHHKNTKDTLIKSILTEDDMHGIRVSMCSALADRSFWAFNHGYRSIKECQSCLWSKTDGDVSYYNFKFNEGEV